MDVAPKITVEAERAGVAARGRPVRRVRLAVARETPGVGSNVQRKGGKRKRVADHREARGEGPCIAWGRPFRAWGAHAQRVAPGTQAMAALVRRVWRASCRVALGCQAVGVSEGLVREGASLRV